MTKAERERVARTARLRVVALRMFEAGGSLNALERDLGKAGLHKVAAEVRGWRDLLDGWREKIGGAAC